MTENNNGVEYPKIMCGKCSIEMIVIGVGTASGRLTYQCEKCGDKQLGKNLAAMQLGSLGGRARAAALTEEQRREQAIKGGKLGGKARAANLSQEERSEQSKRAANILWQKKKLGL